MVYGLVFAAVTVIAPPGWVEDPTRAAELQPEMHAATQLFHPPGDAENLLVVAVPPVSDDPQVALVEVANSIVMALGRAEHHNSDTVQGRVIEDAIVTSTNGRHVHVRVSYTVDGPPYEGVVAQCVGTGPQFLACEKVLSSVEVAPVPSRNNRWLSFLLAFAIVTAGGFWFRRRRASRPKPLVEGEVVTVTGIVVATGDTIQAPLSGRRCVAHRSRVLGTTTVQEQQTLPFDVATRMGRICVRASAITLDVSPEVVIGNTPRHAAFRERNKLGPEVTTGFDEIVVEPGQRITIRGLVASEIVAAGERGYRDAPARIIMFVDPVIISRI